ncbi:hypothetical protein M378DRAFT_11283 [Amanita muscaria Koide BX008]|uniref:Uncharacterized protein n=1 Tax=Amanita muscaria (strain Koide BX008) TaxID=946122 RepID=A0A0C2X7J4_AMAMK|nr:hypothetical protein M378DRAFT_11283 [Amanita muscaria Koide BX008]
MVDQPQGPQQMVSGSLYLACVTTFYVGNITLNVYATVAIIYRILRVPNRSRRLRKTCRIIIESGLLYTLPTLVYAITVTILLGKSDPITSLADAIKFSMTGIAFNLLLIRVYEERTAPHDSHADAGSQNLLNSPSTLRFYTVDAAIQETERSISEISAAQSGSGKEVVQRRVVGEKRGKEILPVVT